MVDCSLEVMGRSTRAPLMVKVKLSFFHCLGNHRKTRGGKWPSTWKSMMKVIVGSNTGVCCAPLREQRVKEDGGIDSYKLPPPTYEYLPSTSGPSSEETKSRITTFKFCLYVQKC